MQKNKPALFGLVIMAALLFSGCGEQPATQTQPESSPSAIEEAPLSTPTVPASAQPETDLTPSVYTDSLIIWVPPAFNPRLTASGLLLKKQVDEFMQNHPGVNIDIRTKDTDGPAGIETSLKMTLENAPDVAPSLVLMPDDDLGSAAMLSLLQSPGVFQALMESDDWYDYSRKMVLFQNNYYGIPFAADAMILALRTPDPKSQALNNWESLLSTSRPLLFAAADKQALFTMGLYLSAGGTFYDEKNKPNLNIEILEKVLSFYASSYSAGYVSSAIMEYEDEKQTWSVFEEIQSNQVVCWISDYFSQSESDVYGLTVPPLGNEPMTMVSGWVWTLTDPYQDRMELDMELLQLLTEPDFQASIAITAGYLPVRPSNLSKWNDPIRTALISQATISAISRPSSEIVDLFGPVFSEAVYNVIVKDTLPSEAARDAIEEISPE